MASSDCDLVRGGGASAPRAGASAPRSALLAAFVLVGLAAAISLQAARERWYPAIGSPVDELYFTSGDAVGRLALSYKSLLADIYWIRAVQYFGSTRIEARSGGAHRAARLRPPLSAARRDDIARSGFQHRLPVRVDLSR
jgi:hypothetical protein